MEDSVIKAIQSDKTKMRSRWFFAVRTALFTLVVLILFAALLYLTSFIVFILRQSGVLLAPGFGLNGWLLFLGGLPWGLLLLSLVLIVVLAALLNHYEFVYRHPLFYALFSFVLIVVFASFWIAATSFHRWMFAYSTENFPLMGQFYQFETEEPSSIHRGEIVVMLPQVGFVIAAASGITSTVVASRGVVFSDEFHAGENVVIFGEREPDGTIEAFGAEQTAP